MRPDFWCRLCAWVVQLIGFKKKSHGPFGLPRIILFFEKRSPCFFCMQLTVDTFSIVKCFESKKCKKSSSGQFLKLFGWRKAIILFFVWIKRSFDFVWSRLQAKSLNHINLNQKPLDSLFLPFRGWTEWQSLYLRPEFSRSWERHCSKYRPWIVLDDAQPQCSPPRGGNN